jgi:hypothetical protein
MTHQCLGLLDMLMSKEELSVQVAEIDCIEIHDMNLSEASKNQILEQFAANSTIRIRAYTIWLASSRYSHEAQTEMLFAPHKSTKSPDSKAGPFQIDSRAFGSFHKVKTWCRCAELAVQPG